MNQIDDDDTVEEYGNDGDYGDNQYDIDNDDDDDELLLLLL